MNDAPAGWYPDGHGSVRWWDGSSWTVHAQPLEQPAAAAEAAPEATTNRRAWWVLGLAALGVLALVGVAVAALVGSSGPSATTATCAKLDAEAVNFAQGQPAGQAQLQRVDDPVVVQDNTATFTRPKAGEEPALVLSCRGLGTYSDGTQSTTTVQLAINASGVHVVTYATS